MTKKVSIRNLIIFFLTFTMALMLGNVTPAQAASPGLSNSNYMKTYVLSTGNNTRVYTSSSLKTRGTSSPYKAYNAAIYASDEVYVYSINDTYCYISYPTSSGRKYGYISTSAITANNYSVDAVTSTGKFTTYRRAGSTKYGYVAKGDTVYTIASSGSYRQIIYPVGKLWKMGWCSESDYNKYVQGSCTISGGKYVITSALDNSYAIDVNGNYTSDGTNIQVWSKSDNNDAQIFNIESAGNGYYKIIHSYSGKALDVCNGEAASGVNVWLYHWNGTDAQLWRFSDAGNGYYYIKNKLGYYLDVSSGNIKNGQNIWVYSGNGTTAQKFKLNSYSKAETNDVSARLQALIDTYVDTTWNGYYYGIQCKGFANMIFSNLFGVYIGPYDSATKSYIPNPNGATEVGRLTTKTMTEAGAKNILLKGQPGDFIQVRRRNKTYGHTMILVGTDSNGITVFDCNSDGKNGVKKYDITWSQFYNKNSAMSLYHANNYK
jgi:hypothetical protein